MGPPLHRMPGKAGSRPALVSLGFPLARLVFSKVSRPHSRPRPLLREILDAALAVAFPTDCALCAGELPSDGWLRICPACCARFEAWTGPLCTRCGLPFPSPRALDASLAECGLCLRDKPAFDRARSFGLYTGKLRQAILLMKYAGDERLGVRLGELLASHMGCVAPAERIGLTSYRSGSLAPLAPA